MVFHDFSVEKEKLDNTYVIKEIHEKISVEHKKYINLYCQKIDTQDMFVRCIVNQKFVQKNNIKFEIGMKVLLLKKELAYPERRLIIYDLVEVIKDEQIQNNINNKITN